MRLIEIIGNDGVVPRIRARERDEALVELVDQLVSAKRVQEEDREDGPPERQEPNQGDPGVGIGQVRLPQPRLPQQLRPVQALPVRLAEQVQRQPDEGGRVRRHGAPV